MKKTGLVECRRCGAKTHVLDPHDDIAECSFELQFHKAYISVDQFVICNKCAETIMPFFEGLMNLLQEERDIDRVMRM